MKRIMAWVLIILDILILPLAVMTVLRWLGIPEKALLMNGYFIISIMAIILLRCFFIPYIAAGIAIPVLMFYYIREMRAGLLRRREMMIFIILALIAILGLLPLERVFMAAMSV